MDNTENYIEGLFTAAREQAPKRSLTEVESRFDTSIADGYRPSFKISNSIFNKFNLIMGTGILLLVISVFVLSTDNGPVVQEERSVRVVTEEFKRTPPQEDLPLAEEIMIISEVDIDPAEEADRDQTVSNRSGSEKVVEKETQNGKAKGSVKSTGSILPYATSRRDDGPEHRTSQNNITFTINNRTSKDDLEDIKEQAKMAGVDLSYRIRGSRPIKKLKLEMVLKTEEAMHRSSISLDGKFEFTIGWVVDESGRAIECWNDLAKEDDGPLFEDDGEGEGLFKSE